MNVIKQAFDKKHYNLLQGFPRGLRSSLARVCWTRQDTPVDSSLLPSAFFFCILLHSIQEEDMWTTFTTFRVSTEIAATTASVADYAIKLHEALNVTPASTIVSSSSSREQSTSPFKNFHFFTSQAARLSLVLS